MYDEQDRPPWLRNLRPAKPGQETELYTPAPTVTEPAFERDTVEGPTVSQGVLTRRQILLLALLLWGNISVLGCLCLLATQVVVP